MARRKSRTLTDAELRLMRIIWELKSCTVSDILGVLPADEPLAYSTVLTTVRILEEKGYLRHDKVGRAFVYEPIVKPQTARKDALRVVMERFFNSSPQLLVANVLEEENLSRDVLDQLKQLLDDASDERTDDASDERTNDAKSEGTP